MVSGLEESVDVQKVDLRRYGTGSHRVKRFVRTLEREAGEKEKEFW